PGRHDQLWRLDLGGADRDRVAVFQPAVSGDDLDLVLLHKELHALVQLVDDRVTSGGDLRVVVSDLVGADPELGSSGRHPVVQLRRLQQGLGGDAADVEAGAAELVLLDQGDLQTELGSPDRGRIAAHAAAQDHNVEVSPSHQFKF